MYQNLFPKAVFSFENGLTIYEMRVKSHNTNVNAVIGGPHWSFKHSAQNTGVVSILFANLSKQLQNFQQLAHPRLREPCLLQTFDCQEKP